MRWLRQQVSIYCTFADNVGRPATIRKVLTKDYLPEHSEISVCAQATLTNLF